jgi:hypothetical protein
VQSLSRDEALAELARRFFKSHGPATIRDFAWWSGLSTGDGRRAIEMIGARRLDAGGHTYWTSGSAPKMSRRSGGVHLLPIYDEYVVAYRDREAVPHLRPATSAQRPFVTFQHALVVDGQVVGTWRLARFAKAIHLQAYPLRPLTRSEKQAITHAASRYARFASTRVELTISTRA